MERQSASTSTTRGFQTSPPSQRVIGGTFGEIDIRCRRKRIDAESFKTSPFSTLNILLASAGTIPVQAFSKVTCEESFI